jgi:UDP-galactopyranose mutase
MDLLCFSHLRWDFVYQRPNHLLSRAARTHRAFFVEEPMPDATVPYLARVDREGVTVVVPHVVDGGAAEIEAQLRQLVDGLVRDARVDRPVLWYYTPMALPWTIQLHETASAVVYDCMDHLAGFLGAPASLLSLEERLMASADLVFTGGRSLYEARKDAHPAVHCFPSSVDVRHFARARLDQPAPLDQARIAGPRIGYFGVLDERIDWSLIDAVAASRPDWQLILLGPIVKVDPATLPAADNIHYLGPKPYADLPAYLAGWDAAMMPFARNEATRFISPTKTPEYLAGGRPVASTSIRDVVSPYGDLGLVHIGDSPEAFIVAVGRALEEDLRDLRERADAYLADDSWDITWSRMDAAIERVIQARAQRSAHDRAIPGDRPGEAAPLVGLVPA